jgi:glutamyl-tRNA synthetase
MNNNEKKVVTRFAPSPTGLLHVGNYRTAVFSYLFALQNNGKFVLRIEDTDKARSKKEYEDNIIESLKWLNFKYDEFYRQSERAGIHKKYLEKLISENKAYISKEEVKEEGQRSEVIRFRNPNKKVKFNDMIRGDIEFDTTELGDFIIAKSMDEPVFHLVVVVDDFEMGITHVIRGEDHISNTQRHILIQEAIGAPTPYYAHLPLVLSPDRSKLSKRKGALAITEYRDRGYLPETMINGMAMLGWNPGTDQEIFSLEELVKTFNISKVQKGGAIFNEDKLLWMNKEYIKRLPSERIFEEIKNRIPEKHRGDIEIIKKIQPVIIDRVSIWSDIDKMVSDGDLQYYFEKPKLSKEMMVWKKGGTEAEAKENLSIILPLLENISEDNFTVESVKEAIWKTAEEKGRGNVLWPLRVSLSGKEKSPDPFILSGILGKTEVLARIKESVEFLSK